MAMPAACAAAVLVVAACSPSGSHSTSGARPSSATNESSVAAAALGAWGTCDGPPLTDVHAQCATARTPIDYTDPSRGTTTLAVARIVGSAPGSHRVVFANLGGPGNPSRPAVALVAKGLGGAAAGFDIYAIDQRAAGASDPRSCGAGRLWQYGAGATADGNTAAARARELAADCVRALGPLATRAGSTNLARDIEAVRRSVGAARIDLIGYSFGSMLAATYAHLFPMSLDRLVLDSVVSPVGYPASVLPNMTAAQDAALADVAGKAARDRTASAVLGTTASGVQHTVLALESALAKAPLTVGKLVIDDHTFPVLLRVLLTNQEDDAQAVAFLVELRKAMEHRITVGRATPVLTGLVQQMTSPAVANFNAAGLATLCADGQWPRDPQVYADAVERSRSTSPLFGPANTAITPCAFWPQTQLEAPIPGAPTATLLVQATRDINTPLAGAKQMQTRFPDSAMVTVDRRDHPLFGVIEDACVNAAVSAFLRGGPATTKSCG